MIKAFLFLSIGYLLGSVPFGYIISKLFGKNILDVGWKKTSSTNVVKNVGFIPGVVTMLLDFGKGFLAVWLAQIVGLSVTVRALCGVAAVIGHNWSCFLKFAGGRGLSTLWGALTAFSPSIFGTSFGAFVLTTLVWNAAIGTIVFLIIAIILSAQFGSLESELLVAISALPMFIKRLSPLKEIKTAKNKAALIRNRLLFDDNVPRFDLRIKRIFTRLTKK